jgi:hypothetical protein
LVDVSWRWLRAGDVAHCAQNCVVTESAVEWGFDAHAILHGYECRFGGYGRSKRGSERGICGFGGADYIVEGDVRDLVGGAHDAVGDEGAGAPEFGLQVDAATTDSGVVGAADDGEFGEWVLGESPA